MIKLSQLLFENTYKQEVGRLSRLVFDSFKKNLGKNHSDEFEGIFPSKSKNRNIQDEVEFDVEMAMKVNTKLKGFPYTINAGLTPDEISVVDINIEYNPEAFPAAYNDLNADLKEVIRHEMEHLSQDVRQNMNWEFRGDRSFAEYLVMKHEVPAYVKGLKAKARTKKISLEQAMDDYFKEYKDSFKNQSEPKKVKKVWMDWAKKHMPNAI